LVLAVTGVLPRKRLSDIPRYPLHVASQAVATLLAAAIERRPIPCGYDAVTTANSSSTSNPPHRNQGMASATVWLTGLKPLRTLFTLMPAGCRKRADTVGNLFVTPVSAPGELCGP